MRRLKRSDIVALITVSLLFVVVAESVFLVSWPSDLHDIPAYNGTDATGSGVANSLFNNYVFTVILIGLLLATAMIGGIYLAKKEGEG